MGGRWLGPRVGVWLLLAAAVVSGVSALTVDSRAASADDEVSPARRADTIPFVIVSHRPVLDVYINDAGPFEFALDMGATGIGRIESELADSIGLPYSGTTTNFDGVSRASARLVRVDRFSVGPLRRSGVELMTRSDYAHQGLVARGFFADRLLTVDYPNRRLILGDTLLDPADPEVVGYTSPFHVAGSVDGTDATFYLDTGSNMTFLFPTSFLRENGVEFDETGSVYEVRRANNEHDVVEARLRGTVRIGSQAWPRPLIYHSDVSRQINVGGEALKDFRVSFDQRSGRVAIRRSEARR